MARLLVRLLENCRTGYPIAAICDKDFSGKINRTRRTQPEGIVYGFDTPVKHFEAFQFRVAFYVPQIIVEGKEKTCTATQWIDFE
jgi:hypothetical protein